MVSCLFAREVYKESVLAECLNAVGYGELAKNLDAVARKVQQMRWQIRLKTGFDPASVTIPKRFTEVVTWNGPIDAGYMTALQDGYSQKIREMAAPEGPVISDQ
jgi:aldehyde:ferredoxin oxidoreductase